MTEHQEILLRLVERVCPTRVEVVQGHDQVSKLIARTVDPSKPELDPVEALYVLYRGRAMMTDKNGSMITFEDYMKLLASCDDHAWIEFEVYLDLRKRGRLPVRGPRPHTFLIKRRRSEEKYTHYVLVLEENRRIPFIALKSFIEEASKNGWEPLLAIVDRYGDITYYKPRVLVFERR